MFAARGDAHAGIDDAPGSIAPLLELAARQAAEGQGEAPLPPYFAKGADEPARVAPSRAKLPVITIAKAKHRVDALDGLARWKAKYPEVVARLAPEHVLIDANRGRSSAWYRVRINLKDVPVSERPPAEDPDPDYDWKTEYAGSDTSASPSDDEV
jgi:hypothetical protein